jgi:hypothetical protein
VEVGVLLAENVLLRRVFQEPVPGVHLEGLDDTVTFYVRIGDGEPEFHGDLATRAAGDPALELASPPTEHFRFLVRDAEGNPVDPIRVSLGDLAVGTLPPPSARLFGPRSIGDGSGGHELELALTGRLTIRVTGESASDGAAMATLDPNSPDRTLELALTPPPPEAEPTAESGEIR